jgi:hypothetical protein
MSGGGLKKPRHPRNPAPGWPRFAYATVATLVLAGVLLGTYQGAQTVKQTEQARYLAAVAPNSLR